MKFSLKFSYSSARLGVITGLSRLPQFEMETPHVLLYTRGGTVPHLTPDVIQTLTNLNSGLHIPIAQIMHLQERIQSSQVNVAKFIGMDEYLTYCSFIDPGKKRLEGYHEKKNIPLFSKFGKRTFSAANYMDVIQTFQPDMFLILADGDTNFESSQKRCLKSLNNTLNLYNDCLELYENSSTLKKIGMVAALEGGYNVALREECSKVIGEGPAFGVVLDGFHDCSEKVAEIEFKNIQTLVLASLKHIPSDKLRMIHGSWNPGVMLDLVDCGIDLFDTSYPFIVTEQNGAFIFPNDDTILCNCFTPETTQINGHIANGVTSYNQDHTHSEIIHLEESPCKKMKLNSSARYFISMADSSYALDFSPILKSCSCYTCKHHTKAYIHHLVKVKELLGLNLIMIHNLHHYFQFLSLIRKSLSDNMFEKLKENFHSWEKNENIKLGLH